MLTWHIIQSLSLSVWRYLKDKANQCMQVCFSCSCLWLDFLFFFKPFIPLFVSYLFYICLHPFYLSLLKPFTLPFPFPLTVSPPSFPPSFFLSWCTSSSLLLPWLLPCFHLHLFISCLSSLLLFHPPFSPLLLLSSYLFPVLCPLIPFSVFFSLALAAIHLLVCSSAPINMKVQHVNGSALVVRWARPEVTYHPPILHFLVSYSWTSHDDSYEETHLTDAKHKLVGTYTSL